MEIRELRYFLSVAREGNISQAAKVLYIAQPSLSRAMNELEKEVGYPLFIRGSRKITLTDKGILLRKRAEEIISLYDKTNKELLSEDKIITGDVYIGGGESYAIETIAKITKEMHDEYKEVLFHFYSADTNTIIEQLDKGLIDFGILIEPCDLTKYEYIRLPLHDTWGLLVKKDNPLAQKEFIIAQDLKKEPLLISRHLAKNNPVDILLGLKSDSLNIVATYNLIYNASLLVKQGLGSAVCIDKLINEKDDDLVFIPFRPTTISYLDIAWKKYQVFSKAGEEFLRRINALL